METITLLLFCGCLLSCILFDLSVLYALVAGLLVFLLYGRLKGLSWAALVRLSLSGIKTVKNILIIFVLIGMLTALWRASGTIPVIICYAAKLIHPSIFILMSFLLNCLVSLLTGTAFGTAATMGVICSTMAAAMGINPIFVGGAILSGVYFGDRCSPVSTSALLVAALTETDIYENIKRMCRTALVPFLLTCGVYLFLGLLSGGSGDSMDVEGLFSRVFRLHWLALLPAVSILLLSVFRVNVKKAMAVSILLAAVLCFALQGLEPSRLPQLLVLGYRAHDPEVSAMLDGGGILSMVRVTAIVCISSCYAGIFEGTGLLVHAKESIGRLGGRITPLGSTICTSIAAGLIACNQTLTIMLTDQLCKDLEPDRQVFAIDLENSAVVLAPLVPWSIAGAVPIASVGAPTASLFAACFLYLVPIWYLGTRTLSGKGTQSKRTRDAAPS